MFILLFTILLAGVEGDSNGCVFSCCVAGIKYSTELMITDKNFIIINSTCVGKLSNLFLSFLVLDVFVPVHT